MFLCPIEFSACWMISYEMNWLNYHDLFEIRCRIMRQFFFLSLGNKKYIEHSLQHLRYMYIVYINKMDALFEIRNERYWKENGEKKTGRQSITNIKIIEETRKKKNNTQNPKTIRNNRESRKRTKLDKQFNFQFVHSNRLDRKAIQKCSRNAYQLEWIQLFNGSTRNLAFCLCTTHTHDMCFDKDVGLKQQQQQQPEPSHNQTKQKSECY